VFKKDKSKIDKITSCIGAGTSIGGEFRFCEGAHIDGTVDGSVYAVEMKNSALVVSELGNISGNVYVETLLFNGQIKGDIYASKIVRLGANARVSGNVFYHKVEMAMGAEVVGKLIKLDQEAWESMSIKSETNNDYSLSGELDNG